MSQFKSIKVKEVRKETNDTVSISFDISNVEYKSGQYITIKKNINGEDVRRSYSLCSSPFESDFRVAVKQIEKGLMSTFLNNELKIGDEIELMMPTGNFVIEPVNDQHYVAFAAGSGITPIVSMIKTVLNKTNSFFTLFYGNKTPDTVIFKKEIDQLIENYQDRFKVKYIYSRAESNDKLFEGRIDKSKAYKIIQGDNALLKANAFFMCGPEQMIHDVSDALKESGVAEDKIRYELFTTPSIKKQEDQQQSDFDGTANVTVIMDGDELEFELSSNGEFILDAAIEQGVDAPFSCKGAVCCTCKAQVIEGKAIMDMNYALSDNEVEEGFILTCQSRPASEKVVVDFDVI